MDSQPKHPHEGSTGIARCQKATTCYRAEIDERRNALRERLREKIEMACECETPEAWLTYRIYERVLALPQEKIKNAENQRAFDREAEEAKKVVFSVVDSLVQRHLPTLLAQRRMGIYEDHYGRTIFDKWWNEVRYFVNNVLDEELETSGARHSWMAWAVRLDLLAELCPMTAERSSCADGDEYVERLLMLRVIERVQAAVATKRDQGECNSDLSEIVEGCSPEEFERFCAESLRDAGWEVRTTKRTGDQGVDIVARREGVTAVFQCKKYSSSIGNKAVQEVHTGGVFYRADYAVVVSNADYTPGARAAAAQTGVALLHWSELTTFDPTKSKPKK